MIDMRMTGDTILDIEFFSAKVIDLYEMHC